MSRVSSCGVNWLASVRMSAASENSTSAIDWVRKRPLSSRLASVAHTTYRPAPRPNSVVRAMASDSPAGAGVAMEKTIENITAMAMGMPRLPQAMATKAMKVAGTSSSPRRIGAPCSICTAKNSGRPMSGAGSICKNLPRRGPGRSGGAVTITPVAAAEAARVPSHRCTPPEITSRPSATVSPLAT
ncbi:hypothetical protein D9M69_517490 [compost metagenome]